jgi:drug/metabolite transporter (DMT)-like permease
MFITALSIPVLGHHVGIWRWSAIIIGFVGVITIMQPFEDGFVWFMALPVTAAFFYAVSSILVRFFPPEVPSAAIQFNQQVLTCMIALAALLIFQQPVPVTSVNDGLLFVLVGIFGGTGVMCIVIAYRLADPSSVSPFEYFGIPISFCLGWLFFAEAPFGDLFPGILFIVSAGILIMVRERITARRAADGG